MATSITAASTIPATKKSKLAKADFFCGFS